MLNTFYLSRLIVLKVSMELSSFKQAKDNSTLLGTEFS